MTPTEIITSNVSQIVRILKNSTFVEREDYDLILERLNNIVNAKSATTPKSEGKEEDKRSMANTKYENSMHTSNHNDYADYIDKKRKEGWELEAISIVSQRWVKIYMKRPMVQSDFLIEGGKKSDGIISPIIDLSKNKEYYDDAEKVMLDHTASTKWDDIKDMTWNSAEVHDIIVTALKLVNKLNK